MALGSIEDKYRRTYVCINPEPASGPDTWRLAVPLEIGTDDHGDGTSQRYDFAGESPIVVSQTPALTPNKDDVLTSFDISQLEDRAD